MRPRSLAVLSCAALWLLPACDVGTARASEPERKPRAQKRERLLVVPVETLPVEPELAPEVNAGVITRAALDAELARGIGRFLQHVRTQPALVNGRFVGWRILSLFADRPDVKVSVLRPGDTVRRVAGQSIERPEQFKAVWDSLSGAKELVVDIERAGRLSKLRYTIAE